MNDVAAIDKPPAHLRVAYLDSLPEPQELYLEQLVAAGKSWAIGDWSYGVSYHDRLVEFYVSDTHAQERQAAFAAICKAAQVRQVLAKSFDLSLLFAAFAQPAEVRTAGLLFRRIVEPGFTPIEGLSFRPGRIEDVEKIVAFDDGFFDSADEIRGYVANNGLFVLEGAEGVVGCGIGTHVIPGHADVDIGMLVAPSHRRRGYGSHIIAFLKDHYLKQGARPICGCSADNVGSMRALANAGFLCEHRVLEISSTWV